MALPPMRAANRRKGGGGLHGYSDPVTQREPGFKSRMQAHQPMGSRGSPRSRNMKGTGYSAGSDLMPAVGPGAAGHRKMGMGPQAYPSRSTPSGSAPAGMEYNRGEGKDRYGR